MKLSQSKRLRKAAGILASHPKLWWGDPYVTQDFDDFYFANSFTGPQTQFGELTHNEGILFLLFIAEMVEGL
jgi:hypothetical protein